MSFLRISLAAATLALALPAAAGPLFRRGDCDGDGSVLLSDAIFGLTFQFLGGAKPLCADACDTDDSGGIDLSDMVGILSYLFSAGEEPRPPGPRECGPDPTADGLEPCAAGAGGCP